MGLLHHVKELRPLHRVTELGVACGEGKTLKVRPVQKVVGVAGSVDDDIVSILVNEFIEKERDGQVGGINLRGSSFLWSVPHHAEGERLALEGEGAIEKWHRLDGDRIACCRSTLNGRVGRCRQPVAGRMFSGNGAVDHALNLTDIEWMAGRSGALHVLGERAARQAESNQGRRNK